MAACLRHASSNAASAGGFAQAYVCVHVCRSIYHNVAANAVRLAKSEANVKDIARIAAGEPDDVANGQMTKGQESGDVQTGLQGTVDKSRHAVG